MTDDAALDEQFQWMFSAREITAAKKRADDADEFNRRAPSVADIRDDIGWLEQFWFEAEDDPKTRRAIEIELLARYGRLPPKE